MADEPLISVIIPVYKVEQYLRQCLDSIVNQTYRNIEILIIDDGSPDRCDEICIEYEKKDNRIRVFHNQENRGLSAARNRGLDEARGQYIGFVDSDDWIELDMYEVLLKSIHDSDVAICGYWDETMKSQIDRETSDSVVFDHCESLRALADGKISAFMWNKLFRRRVFETIRFPDGKNFEDFACIHRIIACSRQITINSACKYHYRCRKDSISQTNTAANLLDYADAWISRYFFFQKECTRIFFDKKDSILCGCIKGISRVWRCWYGCNKEEKIYEINRLEGLKAFVKVFFSPFMHGHIPVYLRLVIFLMRHSNTISFVLMYSMNQIYCWFVKPRFLYP